MNRILNKPISVLDAGYVCPVDYMGSDESIVKAARISYGKETKRVHEDRGLIRYLMRHHHTTPFEMCELKLQVKVPMDCWRQWIRHRTANVNEYSTRYSVAIDNAQRTDASDWRSQTSRNKQGSDGFLDLTNGALLSRDELKLQEHARKVYSKRLKMGVAREQARKDLPLSTYTEAVWKIDLHNLFHFLWLRMAPLAQYEIRCYANVIGNEIVSKWCPIAWEAFLDYRLNSLTLSRIEADVIRAMQSEGKESAIASASKHGLIPPAGEEMKRNRERDELEDKLTFLGMPIPWQSH
ncbi:MAG: FAD-dependent thymidylate synthase [Bacteroidota bacterium]